MLIFPIVYDLLSSVITIGIQMTCFVSNSASVRVRLFIEDVYVLVLVLANYKEI